MKAISKRYQGIGRGMRRQSGFTLVELMVVVLVLSILAGIAYASYDNLTIASRRKAGAACLLEASQFMERFYTTGMTYAGGDTAMPATGCQGELSTFYTFGFTATPTATAYSLRAVPRGQQASKDTKCGTLSLSQTGAQTVSGSGSPAECW